MVIVQPKAKCAGFTTDCNCSAVLHMCGISLGDYSMPMFFRLIAGRWSAAE